MPLNPSLTLAGLKRRVDRVGASDDDLLADYLAAAFETAQKRPPFGTGRLLLPEPALDANPPVTKRIVNDYSRFVRVPDAREITQVLGDDVEIPTDQYEVLERNDHIVRLELRRRCRIVKVTGRFGFATLSADLTDAIYILAARAYYEANAQYADQVAYAEGAAVQAYFRQLPPRTKLIFNAYTVPHDLYGLA